MWVQADKFVKAFAQKFADQQSYLTKQAKQQYLHSKQTKDRRRTKEQLFST